MPTSAWCSATASLTPSPRNATSAPVAPRHLDDPRLLIGTHPGEHTRRRIARAEHVVVHARRCSAPVSTIPASTPICRQTVAATVPLSPVMIFTSIPELVQPRDGRAGVELRPVDEGQKPDQLEIAFVRPAGASRQAHRASRPPRHAHRSRRGPRASARPPRGSAVQRASTALGRALGDQQPAVRARRRAPTPAAVRGRTAPVRSACMPKGRRDAPRPRRSRARPQRLVERIAADRPVRLPGSTRCTRGRAGAARPTRLAVRRRGCDRR